ncbi:unnamed protein product [Blumeria hordei]|uniref:Uncharacterized protein n=1 Tax=Blumeria hordei TaxID=2867405 RepID=A0A383UJP2_BLUHO|nr:unnamed protein product [Blumeria hordei]
MKNLSFVSLALFLSHLMPILAIKDYTCGGVLVPGSTIESKISTKNENLPVEYDRQHQVTDKRGTVVFYVYPPPGEGSAISVEIDFNYREDVMKITATRDNRFVDCI